MFSSWIYDATNPHSACLCVWDLNLFLVTIKTHHKMTYKHLSQNYSRQCRTYLLWYPSNYNIKLICKWYLWTKSPNWCWYLWTKFLIWILFSLVSLFHGQIHIKYSILRHVINMKDMWEMQDVVGNICF